MDQKRLAAAIRAAWTRQTSAVPDEWTEASPSRGQCDVASLVVLEYPGGDLQLAEVLLGGEQVEHHYWNQLSKNETLDLTREQFSEGQELGVPETVPYQLIRVGGADAALLADVAPDPRGETRFACAPGDDAHNAQREWNCQIDVGS